MALLTFFGVLLITGTLVPNCLGATISRQRGVHGPQVDDSFVFDGPAERSSRFPISGQTAGPRTTTTKTTTTTTTKTTSQSPQTLDRQRTCEQNCLATAEYNPICGSDGQTYSNPGRLNCAKRCGKSVEIVLYRPCVSTTTPAT